MDLEDQHEENPYVRRLALKVNTFYCNRNILLSVGATYRHCTASLYQHYYTENCAIYDVGLAVPGPEVLQRNYQL
jgi:hypothetical protein